MSLFGSALGRFLAVCVIFGALGALYLLNDPEMMQALFPAEDSVIPVAKVKKKKKEPRVAEERLVRWKTVLQSTQSAPWQRLEAIYQMREERDPRIRELLRASLKDEKLWVRLKALLLLVHMGAALSTGELQSALGEYDEKQLNRFVMRYAGGMKSEEEKAFRALSPYLPKTTQKLLHLTESLGSGRTAIQPIQMDLN